MAAHRRSILHRFCFLFSPTQSKLLDLIPGPLNSKVDALSFDPAGKYYFFWMMFYKMDHSALWLLTGSQFCSILLLVLAHSRQIAGFEPRTFDFQGRCSIL